jgi:hypothetical protein
MKIYIPLPSRQLGTSSSKGELNLKLPPLLLLQKAFPAQRNITVGFTKEDKAVVFHKAVRMMGEVATLHADGVDFGHIFGSGHQRRYRTERLSKVIHVEPGNDHPNAIVSQQVADIGKFIIEELSFIYSYYIHIVGKQDNLRGCLHRC